MPVDDAEGQRGGAVDGPPRFVADENFNRDIVAGLRRARPGIDILMAAEAEILHLPDPDVLVWAAEHDRIVLSHDKRTMPGHFYRFLAQLGLGAHSPGVLLLPQTLSTGASIEAVAEVWDLSTHREWQDLLVRLPL